MRIEQSRRFEKDFKKLSKKVRDQFCERLRLFMVDKDHSLLHVHALTGELRRYHSFNVTANIRVIFEYCDNDIVRLHAIGTHTQLYG